MAQAIPSDNAKLGVLDGLRGFMSLWVVLGHACLLTGFGIPLINRPLYAVNGFMVISGFLMTYHYILRAKKHPWHAPSTWIGFWIRRFFRLSPLYFLLLIPSYLLMSRYTFWRSVIDNANHTTSRFASSPPLSAEHVLLHLTYLFGLFPRFCSSLVMPDWSLSLEMQFYLVFPFLMLLALRFGWIPFSIVMTVIYAAARHTAFAAKFVQPSPLYLSLLWFIIGMVWASHFFDAKKKIFYAIAGCVLALASASPISVLLICFFALMVFAQTPLVRPIQNALSGRLSKFLADASYSVYLVHLLILTPTVWYLATHTHLSVPMRFLIATTITLAISYGLAKPLEVIENYGHNLGKKIADRTFRPHPSPINAAP